MAVQPTRPTRPASTAPRSATSTTTTEPGAPAKPLDEATATLLAALFLALAKSRGGDSFETAFSRALTRLGESKTVTDGKLHYAPTPAQFVVSRAQAAGIVEGDILGRLGAKS